MELLQSPWFWLAVLVGAIIAWAKWRPAPCGGFGFQDFLKNPEIWSEKIETAHRDDDQAIEAAKGWSDNQVQTAVRRFVFDVPTTREAWTDWKVLKSLGKRTHVVLLQILNTSSLSAKLVKPTGIDLMPESPFDRICDLFGDSPPAEVADLISPFLESSANNIRSSAGIVLGSTGTKAAILPIRKALADEDEYVRLRTMSGLERAVAGQRLADECRKQLLPDLESLLVLGKNGNRAAGLLCDFDGERALAFCLSERIFRPEVSALGECLYALNEKGLLVPRERLLWVIDQLRMCATGYPQTGNLSRALHALGKHQVAEDRATLDAYITHSQGTVALGAAEGILALHGLDRFRKRIYETIKDHGYSALTVPQRLYLAVLDLDGEVTNGGFSQYFFNSSGNDWQLALAGLEAIGSQERLALFRTALAPFGPAGPSEDRAERMEQLSQIVQTNESADYDLESRYYKSTEEFEVVALPYILKNADAFR